MLNINSINQGIVIDHIKPGLGLKIFEFLNLANAEFTIALIINANSKKYGCKDIIKIENEVEVDLEMLGFLDPNITVNIIKNEVIVEKINLSLPKVVEKLVKCKNPRCITSEERNIVNRFVLIDKDKAIYKCDYCDHIYSWEG